MAAKSAIIDGRAGPDRSSGAAHFYRLLAQMRMSHPGEALIFIAFNLLEQDGDDLRGLPYPSPKRDSLMRSANRPNRILFHLLRRSVARRPLRAAFTISGFHAH